VYFNDSSTKFQINFEQFKSQSNSYIFTEKKYHIFLNVVKLKAETKHRIKKNSEFDYYNLRFRALAYTLLDKL